MEKYQLLEVIGEGTYGTVYKARHKDSNNLYAIKKFKENEDNESVRKTAMREINMLKLLKHENIVSLVEVIRKNKKIYLVFEYVERTVLNDLERSPQGIDPLKVRQIMYQLLTAVNFCHENNVTHRDIKPENLLISKNGVLKICDFGFARGLTSVNGQYTDYVSTRWYRAPELLVGDTEYGKPVDIWAIGCIFAELLTGLPLFPGDSDLDTLSHILRLLDGNLSQKQLIAFEHNPMYIGQELPSFKKRINLEQKHVAFEGLVLDMVKSCFEFDPEKRATCVNLLNHGYFDDRFKVSFENEMAEILGKEIRDKHLSYRRSISNESQSPEPNLLSKFTSRDTTPNRTGQKSIGTIRFNPDDLIPFTKTPELCEERHIGPPPNFLPNIKLRRDEDSHNSSFHGLKKKNSELKIPLIKQIKHTNDYHPHHHKLKNIEFGSSVIEKSHNLSTIYEIRDVAIGDQTIRSRNNSKSHIKQRHPDHPYFQSVPTPLPSSKLKNTQYMTKKTKITLYYSYSLKSGMSSNSPNVSRLVKP